MENTLKELSRAYLVCKLNDSDYAFAECNFFKTYGDARRSAILSAVGNFEGNCTVATSNYTTIDGKLCGMRIDTRSGDAFYVTEIKEFNPSNGRSLLVWHHAYNGVDFDILFQGTYEECILQRNERIQKLKEELELDEEDVNYNTVDTGDEWEVFDIVSF